MSKSTGNIVAAIVFAVILAFVGFVVFVSLIIGIAGLVKADTHPTHPPAHEKLHKEFYSDWKMPPNRTVSCCNEKDCYPTPIKFEDGQYWALRREDQRWLMIPAGVLEQTQRDESNIRESPDFQSHACIQDPEFGDTVFCATLGGAN